MRRELLVILVFLSVLGGLVLMQTSVIFANNHRPEFCGRVEVFLQILLRCRYFWWIP